MKKKIVFFLVFGVLLFKIPSLFSGSHPYLVRHMQVSLSGKYLLAGRLDNKIVVWDVLNKKQLYAWASDLEKPFSWQAHFTADEKYVVIQQNNFDLWFIDLATGQLDKVYPLPAQATTLAFYRDGKRFVWGGIDGRIQYEDMQEKESKILKVPLPKEPNLHPAFSGPINQIVLSPDEKYFVSATAYNSSYDKFEDTEEPFYDIPKRTIWYIKHANINLWDATTLEKIQRLKGKDLNIFVQVSFSPEGKTVYASSQDGDAYAWDCETGAVKYKFDGPRAFDGYGTLMQNTYYCGMSTRSHLINLMRTADGKLVKTINFDDSAPVENQMITYDKANMVFIGTEDGSVSMYRFDPKKLELELYWHPKPVKRGVITWIGPHRTLDKTPEQVEAMRQKYIQKQKELGFVEKGKTEQKLLVK